MSNDSEGEGVRRPHFPPARLAEAQNELNSVVVAKRSAVERQDYEEAAALREKEQQLRIELHRLQSK